MWRNFQPSITSCLSCYWNILICLGKKGARTHIHVFFSSGKLSLSSSCVHWEEKISCFLKLIFIYKLFLLPSIPPARRVLTFEHLSDPHFEYSSASHDNIRHRHRHQRCMKHTRAGFDNERKINHHLNKYCSGTSTSSSASLHTS